MNESAPVFTFAMPRPSLWG